MIFCDVRHIIDRIVISFFALELALRSDYTFLVILQNIFQRKIIGLDALRKVVSKWERNLMHKSYECIGIIEVSSGWRRSAIYHRYRVAKQD